MYHKKFDEVLLISPSYAKMGLKIKEENVRSKFSIEWIFEKIQAINEKQMEKVYGHSMGGKKLKEDKLTSVGRVKKSGAVLNDNKSRFEMAAMIKRVST